MANPNNKSAHQAPTGEKHPLLAHLTALRNVLIISAAAVDIAFVLVFYLAGDVLMNLMLDPIRARGIEVIYTAVSEALLTKMKVALIAAIVSASPVIIWQIWSFIKPALFAHEKRLFRLLFFVALLLGIMFCYGAVYMLAVDFFLIAAENVAVPMLSVDKYIGFLFGFVVPFGIAFELPVILYMTTKVNLTDHKMLAAKRKYVILGIAVVAAILTPPDVVSQLLLGIPMLILFEISVLITLRSCGRKLFAGKLCLFPTTTTRDTRHSKAPEPPAGILCSGFPHRPLAISRELRNRLALLARGSHGAPDRIRQRCVACHAPGRGFS